MNGSTSSEAEGSGGSEEADTEDGSAEEATDSDSDSDDEGGMSGGESEEERGLVARIRGWCSTEPGAATLLPSPSLAPSHRNQPAAPKPRPQCPGSADRAP